MTPFFARIAQSAFCSPHRWGIALGLLLSLAGCKDNAQPTRYVSPPGSIAENLEFTDTVMGPGFGGRVVVTRSSSDYDASAYVLRWGNGGVPATLADGVSNFVASTPITQSTDNQLALDFSVASIPAGADSLVVLTSNATGEAAVGISVPAANVYSHPLAPQTKPTSVSFYDSNRGLSITGMLSFRIASWDAGRYNWVLRYADANGCALPGAPLRTFNINTGYIGYNYQITNRDVPREAKSFVVLAANGYGEAFQENCNEYVRSDATRFNEIIESDVPRFQAKAAYFSAPDSDDSYKFNRTLVIEPSEDERDLLGGYYVYWVTSTNDNPCRTDLSRLGYFPKNGGSHTLNITGDIPRFVDKLVVSAGRPCVGSSTVQPAHTISLQNLPSTAAWYLIKNASNGRCISADDRSPGAGTSALSMVTCNIYDTAQRFYTTQITVPDGNNHIFRVQSTKTGGCFEREYWGGGWQLNYTCTNDNLWTQMELTHSNAKDKAAKRIIVRNQVAGTWNYSCAWADLVQTRPTGTWGNCGWGIDMTWYFMPAGNPEPSSFALFNDR